MKLNWMTGIAVALAIGFAASHVIAEDDEMGGGPPPPAEQGEQHKMFATAVGEWDAYTKFWMAPGQPPMEGKDEATFKLIMNGWFLEMNYRGTMMGQKWNGRMTAGYDQARNEFIHVWIADMASHVSIDRGQMNDDGVIVLHGETIDHMTGKPRPSETTYEFNEDGSFVMSMFWCTADKKRESQMLEITYKRKAADTAK